MTTLNRISTAAAFMGVLALLLHPGTSLADITVNRVTHFDGIMGMGASNEFSTEYIAGNKKREQNTLKFTGSILSRFAGPHTSTTIYRVDQGRIITLNAAHHTYTVLPMTAANARNASASHESAPHASGQQAEQPTKQDHTRVIRNELTVTGTGRYTSISGYRCKEYIIIWLVITENMRTRQRSTSKMTSDIWTTPETRALHALRLAELAYNRAYLKRLGLELSPQQEQQFGLNMLGLMSGKNQRELKRAMTKVHGYPISISVKWQSDAKGGNSSGDNTATANSAAALKQAAGSIGGMLSGMFHSNTPKSRADHSSLATIFSSTTKIIKVDTAAVPAHQFDVPAGYHRTSY